MSAKLTNAAPKNDETVTSKSKGASLRSTLDLMRKALPRDEQGATAIEYAMIAAGIGVAIAAAVTKLGSTTATLYQTLLSLFH